MTKETIDRELIKDSRKAAGLTQQNLADLVGVSKITITRIETGRHNPKANVLLGICRVLAVAPNKALRWSA